MKSTEFCYWLQGLFELAKPTELNAEQTELVRRHLDMVFIHDIDKTYPAEQQDSLNAAHTGGPVQKMPNHIHPFGLSSNARC